MSHILVTIFISNPSLKFITLRADADRSDFFFKPLSHSICNRLLPLIFFFPIIFWFLRENGRSPILSTSLDCCLYCTSLIRGHRCYWVVLQWLSEQSRTARRLDYRLSDTSTAAVLQPVHLQGPIWVPHISHLWVDRPLRQTFPVLSDHRPLTAWILFRGLPEY
jgi:hypothetical protein